MLRIGYLAGEDGDEGLEAVLRLEDERAYLATRQEEFPLESFLLVGIHGRELRDLKQERRRGEFVLLLSRAVEVGVGSSNRTF